jgi:hypothetical protein
MGKTTYLSDKEIEAIIEARDQYMDLIECGSTNKNIDETYSILQKLCKKISED